MECIRYGILIRSNANSFADEELLKFRPTDDGEDNPTLKDLKKLNPDVKAWIQVPKTNIDYPVVQGQDDMEYINKNVYGESNCREQSFCHA